MADLREPHIMWRRSTASDSGTCVEVAVAGGSVLVRDSAHPDGAVLGFPPAEWSAFLARTLGRDSRPA